MSLTINSSIFREYDIRGVAFLDLSNVFAEKLGLAYAQLIKGSKPTAGRNKLTIAVGRDCRLSSDSFENALVNGLLNGGIDVIRIGLCPTPLTYFSIYHLNLDGAIMVTASHNPPEHNGFKICVGTEAIYGDQIQQLHLIMERDLEPAFKKGSLSDHDIISDYLSYQINQFSSLKGKKIVIDCGNGMASMIVASKLFRSLGVEVLDIFCELDGTFPNHATDPTVESNMQDLIRTVKENQADFGIGFDGDADRIGVVDENGKLLSGDELMIIFSRSLLKDNPG
jgi:phosphomannomutase/phosphoglucomutase